MQHKLYIYLYVLKINDLEALSSDPPKKEKINDFNSTNEMSQMGSTEMNLLLHFRY
jgi:hypothetical protein